MTWYQRHSPWMTGAILFGAVVAASLAILGSRDRFEIRRDGLILEVWSQNELQGEYQPRDGEIYTFLDDLEKGRL